MPRAKGRTGRKQAPALLNGASLREFRSDLTAFLQLPASFRQRLEKLAAEPRPSREEISRVYSALPYAAVHLLTYVLSLDAEEFSRLREQVGAHAKDLDHIRGVFDALARHFMVLDDKSAGIINSWENYRYNLSYNFTGEYPSLEFWLFDSVGNEIFYSRSDVGDFARLAEGLLECVADSVRHAKEHHLPVTKVCAENVLDAASYVERYCKEIRKVLSGT